MSAVASNVIRMSVICYHPQFLVRIIRIKVNPNHPQGHHHHTGKKQRSSRRGRVPRSREQINQRLHFPLPAWGGGWSRAADWWNVVSPWIIYIHTLSFSCICSCTHLVYLVCELPVVLTGTVIDLFHVVYTLFEHGRSNIGKYYISPWNRNKSFVNNFIAKNKS